MSPKFHSSILISYIWSASLHNIQYVELDGNVLNLSFNIHHLKNFIILFSSMKKNFFNITKFYIIKNNINWNNSYFWYHDLRSLVAD